MGHTSKSFALNFQKSNHEDVPMLRIEAAPHVSRECVRGFSLRDNLCDFYSHKKQCLWSIIFTIFSSLPSSALHTKVLILDRGCRLFGARRWPFAGPLTRPGWSLPYVPAICGRERGRTSCHTRLPDSHRAESYSYPAAQNLFICISWGQDLRLLGFFKYKFQSCTGQAVGLTWGTVSPCTGCRREAVRPDWIGLDCASTRRSKLCLKQLWPLFFGCYLPSPEPCLLLSLCPIVFGFEVGRGWIPKIVLFLECHGSIENKAISGALTCQRVFDVYSCDALKDWLNWWLIQQLMGALGRVP